MLFYQQYNKYLKQSKKQIKTTLLNVKTVWKEIKLNKVRYIVNYK